MKHAIRYTHSALITRRSLGQMMARHVLNVHAHAAEVSQNTAELSVSFLKRFVEYCRSYAR